MNAWRTSHSRITLFAAALLLLTTHALAQSPGLTFSPTTSTCLDNGRERTFNGLCVPKGDSADFTVQLATQPSADVTLTISKENLRDSGDVTWSPASLTFTASNWNQTQTVTVSSSKHPTGSMGQADLYLTPDSDDRTYDKLSSHLTRYRVYESDTPALDFTPGAVTVNEGASGSYNVMLNTPPTANVTLTLTTEGDGDLTVDTDPSTEGLQNTITFTPDAWSWQRVYVSAAEDADDTHGSLTITHTAASTDADYNGMSRAITVTENDNDASPPPVTPPDPTPPTPAPQAGVVLSPTASQCRDGGRLKPLQGLCVPMGGSATFTVRLATVPKANVTLDAIIQNIRRGGYISLSPTSLDFTPDNWNQTQTITATSSKQPPADWGAISVYMRGTSDDPDYHERLPVRAYTIQESDTAALVRSTAAVTVDEGLYTAYSIMLNTPPSANVTLTLSTSDSSYLSVDTDWDTPGIQNTVTFTPTDWEWHQIAVHSAEDVNLTDDSMTITHTSASSDADYNGLTTTVKVTETDNDTPSLVVSSTAVTVPEGGSATYTVKLSNQPNGAVAVRVEQGTSDDTDLTASPLGLDFTMITWNVPQTITLSAAQDGDDLRSTRTFTHTASGANFGDAPAVVVTATEGDDDKRGFVVTPAPGPVTFREGGSHAYTIKLGTQPGANVTVAVAASGDPDVTVSPASLTFTPQNYASAQTVTISAAEDNADYLDDSATVRHTVTTTDSIYDGFAIGDVAVTVDDNDAAIVLSTGSVTVREGAYAGYTLKLTNQPIANVTVTLSESTSAPHNDTSIRVSSPSTKRLTFTTTNWAMPQEVRLYAAGDGDRINGTRRITHTAAGSPEFNGVSATLTAVERDSYALIALTSKLVNVDEGGSATYGVDLIAQPAGNVTVTLAASGDSDVSVSPASLTFTSANYDVAQTVTVSAGADNDLANGQATIAHSASGGGYDGVSTANLTAREVDKTGGITLSPATSIQVTEGSTNTYTVKLTHQPLGTVTVRLAQQSSADGGDTDLRVTSSQTLYFSTTTWDDTQTVTVRAAEDADSAAGSRTISHTASGGGYNVTTPVVLTAYERDNDKSIVFNPVASVTVPEGGTATYTARLNTAPTANVTVTIAEGSGANDDTDITVTSPAGKTLTFTTVNYAQPQTVTLSAAEDNDGVAGSRAISHSASGGGYDTVSATLTATEGDNDTPGVSFVHSGQGNTLPALNEGASTAYTVQLTTAPVANVTITLTKTGPITVSPGTLTFTSSDYGAKTVTVTADTVTQNDSGTIRHRITSTGSDYNNIADASLNVTVTNVPQVLVSKSSLTLTESRSGTYTVQLDTAPTADVTVTPAAAGNVAVSPTSLTFTSSSYGAKTVTVTAGIITPGSVSSVSHTASSTDQRYNNVTIPGVSVTLNHRLSASNVKATTARLTLANRSGNWYYQYTSPDGGTCSTSAVSASSVTVTGLDPGTSYTFAAYSNSSCGNTIGSAAAFTTLTAGLTASNVTGTTARLTIANWRPGTGSGKDGNWYYQYTDPVGGFCSTAQTTASADVDTLTPGQSYTFAAYSDVDCADLLATADAFLATDATVSNLGETASGTFGVSNDHDWATSFTTGSHSRGYTLGSVVARFAADPNSQIKVAAKIYTDSSGAPGTLVATLSGPEQPDDEDAVYTCSGNGCALSASTTYHLVLERSEGGVSATQRPWRNTASDSQTNTPSNAGWTIGNSSSRKASGAWTANHSTNSGMFSIMATEIDGLSVSDVRATTATLTIAGHTVDWYYKHTVPSNGTCTAAGSGASASVTGLTAATKHTFRAYSNSSCTNAISGASVSFTTLPSLVAWITNLSTPKVTAGKVLNASRQQAVAFTTGSHPGGYRLKTFTAMLRVSSVGTGSMAVKLHPMQGSSPYGASSAPSTTALATLAGAGSVSNTWQELTWTCPGAGCDLAADTTYFVVMTYTNSGAYGVAYGSNNSQTVTRYPSDNGWNVRYGHYRTTSWSSVSDHSLARFDFQPKPGLAATVSATTATLTLAGHTGNWWLKRTTPASTTCKAKGTTLTEDLTGLTKGTAYVYQAYSDDTCSTTLGPAASFSTLSPTLTSSNVTHNSATLTLSGWDVSKDGNWYYSWATSAGCEGPISTLSTTASGLDPKASYGFKAFTDSTCSVLNRIAVAPTFTTPSHLAASAVTATTATLTLSGHTAAWYYQADTAPHDNSCTPVNANIASVSLTGLTKGTAYVYTAYSESQCSTAITGATASLTTTTPALAASGITRTSATLTLTGWTPGTGAGKDGNWYYKQGSSDCSGAQSTGTASLSGLVINTDYTYKAYSDVSCNTVLATADAFFTGDTVSNLGETKAAAGNLGQILDTNIKWAVGFTTGSSTHGYGVQSVTGLFEAKTGSPSGFTAAIHAADSGDPAATATCDLTGDAPDTAGEHTFTASSCTLSASTTYFLVLSATGTSGEQHFYRWGVTDSDSQTNTPSTAGWTIADVAKTKHNTEAWTDHSSARTGMLAVKANVLTPSLSAAAITSSGATLTLADYSGTWYYKRIEPALTTCNTASTPTVTLSTLDANKLYGYTAYSNSTCGTALDTVYFSTSSAFVGNLAEADNSFCALGNVNGLALCTTAFTTGSNSLGYTLGAVTARFSSKVNSPGAIVAAIHAADGTNPSNPAATASITLSGSDPDAAGLHTFTCSTSCDLASSTTYFVVFSSPTTATNFQYYRWMITLSDAETLWPAGSGWAIANVGRYKSGTNAWAAMGIDRSGVMHVRATAKTASLAASSITASTARLTITGHTGDWYYKFTSPSSGTCSSIAVSGTTTVATGLGPNTDYTFAAYSDNGCSNTLATASSFTTADVTVSNLSETTGEGNFTIGKHSSNTFVETWATSFTTGSAANGYLLTTVIVKFNAKNGSPGNLTAKIHTDNGGAPADDAVAGPDPHRTCQPQQRRRRVRLLRHLYAGRQHHLPPDVQRGRQPRPGRQLPVAGDHVGHRDQNALHRHRLVHRQRLQPVEERRQRLDRQRQPPDLRQVLGVGRREEQRPGGRQRRARRCRLAPRARRRRRAAGDGGAGPRRRRRSRARQRQRRPRQRLHRQPGRPVHPRHPVRRARPRRPGPRQRPHRPGRGRQHQPRRPVVRRRDDVGRRYRRPHALRLRPRHPVPRRRPGRRPVAQHPPPRPRLRRRHPLGLRPPGRHALRLPRPRRLLRPRRRPHPPPAQRFPQRPVDRRRHVVGGGGHRRPPLRLPFARRLA